MQVSRHIKMRFCISLIAVLATSSLPVKAEPAPVQSPIALATVVAFYAARPALQFDRCVKLGLAEGMDRSAADLFEKWLFAADSNDLSQLSSERQNDMKIALAGYRKGWDAAKVAAASEPDSKFTAVRCGQIKVEFQRLKPSLGVK